MHEIQNQPNKGSGCSYVPKPKEPRLSQYWKCYLFVFTPPQTAFSQHYRTKCIMPGKYRPLTAQKGTKGQQEARAAPVPHRAGRDLEEALLFSLQHIPALTPTAPVPGHLWWAGCEFAPPSYRTQSAGLPFVTWNCHWNLPG